VTHNECRDVSSRISCLDLSLCQNLERFSSKEAIMEPVSSDWLEELIQRNTKMRSKSMLDELVSIVKTSDRESFIKYVELIAKDK